MPFFASAEEFHGLVAEMFARKHELVLGRETAVQARDRFITAVQEALAQRPGDKTAIVAHGTVLTLFISHFNPQIDPTQFWRDLTMPCFFVLSLPAMKLVRSWKMP